MRSRIAGRGAGWTSSRPRCAFRNLEYDGLDRTAPNHPWVADPLRVRHSEPLRSGDSSCVFGQSLREDSHKPERTEGELEYCEASFDGIPLAPVVRVQFASELTLASARR